MNHPDTSSHSEHLVYTYAFAAVLMAAHFGIDDPSITVWPVAATALFMSEMARRGKAMGMRFAATRLMEGWATAAFFYFGYLLWVA